MRPGRHLRITGSALLGVLTVLAGLVGVGAVALGLVGPPGPGAASSGGPAAGQAAAAGTTSAGVRAVGGAEAREALRAWDAARAEAYARGDPAALRALYVRGSRAGRRDLRLLEGFLARGLRVTGLNQQVLGSRVVSADAGRLTLEVTGRVVGAQVRTGGVDVGVLPASRPRTHSVTLVATGDGSWRVARVRRVGPARAAPAAGPGPATVGASGE